jgi:hypothetical protein
VAEAERSENLGKWVFELKSKNSINAILSPIYAGETVVDPFLTGQ